MVVSDGKVGEISEKFVIDGANIAHEEKTTNNKPKLSNIILMKEFLESIGIKNYKIICDRSIFYLIDNQELYTTYIESNEIIEAPGGSKADIFILQYAYRNNGYIISNDRYKEYHALFGKDWIKEHRIFFKIIDQQIYFDKIIIK